MMVRFTRFLACAFTMGALNAHAALLTVHDNLTDFSTDVGLSLLSQDFDAFLAGTDLSGVEVLPGVSVTTNMDSLEAFGAVDRSMFGIGGRDAGDARYDIALSGGHLAFAFEIRAFEAVPGNDSTAVGPGTVTVSFADLTEQSFDVFGSALSPPETFFIGLVSDTGITGVRWEEALEGNGGNEETSLDNFIVAQVPEPATVWLLATALVMIARRPQKRSRG